MNTTNIIIIGGTPRCGKTSLSKKILCNIPNFVYIGGDEIVNGFLVGKKDPILNSFKCTTEYEYLDNFYMYI